jgi:DNA repair exonuclease SbcCD nuclease subunit
VERRRRGHDFFANYQRALDAAIAERVDFVVHGGDVLFRSKVRASLVEQAFGPLKRVADAGIPVIVVPGNHERSEIPYGLLATHPNIGIFHRPETFVLQTGGITVAFAGFPFHRRDVRTEFSKLLQRTGWAESRAAIRLLCLHQCFEGATVGPSDYMFRYAADVVRGADIPSGFAAVLSGHIHRHQALTVDLRGRPLAAPVLYPGSIERTSFAEKDEPKGYLMLTLHPSDSPGGVLQRWEFRELPARPMIIRDLQAGRAGSGDLEALVRRIISEVPPDAILRLKIRGVMDQSERAAITAQNLRLIAPPTMNVEALLVE